MDDYDGVAFDVERITSENITEQKDYHCEILSANGQSYMHL